MRVWHERAAATVRRGQLSALQFGHASLCRWCAHAARHALEPGCLKLEMTESTAMRNADASLRILEQLSAWACASPSTISAPAIRA